MKYWLILIVASLALTARAAECDKPWMFFDLGLNTLLDTSKEDPQTQDMIDVHYVPGAHDYLEKLNELGYHVGMLVDVPEDWGSDDETALATTKDYIFHAWTKESGAQAMDWNQFTPGAIFFPPRNELRKAANSLYLFKKGLALAASYGCKAVHQATRAKEIALAKLAGMKAYQVGVAGRPYYLPIEKIEEFAR